VIGTGADQESDCLSDSFLQRQSRLPLAHPCDFSLAKCLIVGQAAVKTINRFGVSKLKVREDKACCYRQRLDFV
jgi:hypothetical protein